jgi:hypothetical protein
MVTRTDWVKDLKVGDPVLVNRSRYTQSGTTKQLVDKVHKTYLVVDGETFNFRGHQRGSGYHMSTLSPYDPSDARYLKTQHEQLAIKIAKLLPQCSLDQLRKIMAMITETADR